MSCADYNKITYQLQDELESKDHIITKLLTTIGDLRVKIEDNIIHKLKWMDKSLYIAK